MKRPPVSPLNGRFSGPRSSAWDIADRAYALEDSGHDIIHMSIGDPDLDTPRIIRDAAISALNNGRTHYSAVPGEMSFRKAVAEHASRMYGKPVHVDQVVIAPGAQPALFAAFTCIAGPEHEVILLEPSYATYEGAAAAGGARVVSVQLDSDHGFALDLLAIEAAITDKTAAILLNSPGNPTGKVFSREEVSALLRLAKEHGIWLVCDEVYYSYVYDGRHISPFELDDADEHVIVVNSVSKAFAMTGWRIGWVIAPPHVATAIANLSQCSIFGVAQFSQDAAIVALEQAQGDSDAFRAIFHRRRDTLCSSLKQVEGMTVHQPAGGIFLLADISSSGMESKAFANALLDSTGVSVVPGYAFGQDCDRFIRLGFLQKEDLLVKASDRIAHFMGSLRSTGLSPLRALN